MNRVRYLLSNINLMNIMLTGVLFILVMFVFLPFLNKSFLISLPIIVKREKPESVVDKHAEHTKTPLPFDYAMIAEQNLFHPERKIPISGDAQTVPKPDFVLYGTLISGSLKLAFMDDLKIPKSTPGRGKRQHAVSLGRSLSGYVLAEVFSDKVLMVKGDEQIEVAVTESSKSKRTKAGITGAQEQLKSQNKDR